MKRNVIAIILFATVFIMIFALPAMATLYRQSDTSFRYIGKILQEREISFDGGLIRFKVSGEGIAYGYHDARESSAERVYDVTPDSKTHLRTAISGFTATDAGVDDLVRLMSGIWLPGAYAINGLEMNPGEEGSMKHESYSSIVPEGKYVDMQSSFKNTGGKTRRELEIDGFLKDKIDVIGYADVWERTVVSDGGKMTGWWDLDMNP